MRDLPDVCLAYDGLEALRLADLEGISQEESARRMDVSRPTFGRILAEARRAVAEAVVKGMTLRIEGGVYKVVGHRCRVTGSGSREESSVEQE